MEEESVSNSDRLDPEWYNSCRVSVVTVEEKVCLFIVVVVVVFVCLLVHILFFSTYVHTCTCTYVCRYVITHCLSIVTIVWASVLFECLINTLPQQTTTYVRMYVHNNVMYLHVIHRTYVLQNIGTCIHTTVL